MVSTMKKTLCAALLVCALVATVDACKKPFHYNNAMFLDHEVSGAYTCVATSRCIGSSVVASAGGVCNDYSWSHCDNHYNSWVMSVCAATGARRRRRDEEAANMTKRGATDHPEYCPDLCSEEDPNYNPEELLLVSYLKRPSSFVFPPVHAGLLAGKRNVVAHAQSVCWLDSNSPHSGGYVKNVGALQSKPMVSNPACETQCKQSADPTCKQVEKPFEAQVAVKGGLADFPGFTGKSTQASQFPVFLPTITVKEHGYMIDDYVAASVFAVLLESANTQTEWGPEAIQFQLNAKYTQDPQLCGRNCDKVAGLFAKNGKGIIDKLESNKVFDAASYKDARFERALLPSVECKFGEMGLRAFQTVVPAAQLGPVLAKLKAALKENLLLFEVGPKKG